MSRLFLIGNFPISCRREYSNKIPLLRYLRVGFYWYSTSLRYLHFLDKKNSKKSKNYVHKLISPVFILLLLFLILLVKKRFCLFIHNIFARILQHLVLTFSNIVLPCIKITTKETRSNNTIIHQLAETFYFCQAEYRVSLKYYLNYFNRSNC